MVGACVVSSLSVYRKDRVYVRWEVPNEALCCRVVYVTNLQSMSNI